MPSILRKVQPEGKNASYLPGYNGVAAGNTQIQVDEGGALQARSAIMTDEGSYRYNGSGTSLGIQIGSGNLTFTHDSNIVTGTGFLSVVFLHIYEYISIGNGTASPWYQIISFSDTEIELESPYLGTTTTAPGYVCPVKGIAQTGQSVSVANGITTLVGGTTDNQLCELERNVDILPLTKECMVYISQRIANQNIYIGFYDDVNTNAQYYARFDFNGTNPNVVQCTTGFSRSGAPTGNEIEVTAATIPTPAGYNRYRIECANDRVRYIINDVLVAEHRRVIMRPQDYLTSTIQILNGTGVSTSTSVLVNYDSCYNYNNISTTLTDTDKFPKSFIVDIAAKISAIFDLIKRPLWVSSTTSRVQADVFQGTSSNLNVTAAQGTAANLKVEAVLASTTLTSVTQVSGQTIQSTLMVDMERNTWASCVRNRIS